MDPKKNDFRTLKMNPSAFMYIEHPFDREEEIPTMNDKEKTSLYSERFSIRFSNKE